MTKSKKRMIEYRNYSLLSDFPVLMLSGNHWKISDIPSDRLHFHNCMEIGICHSEGGFLEFYDKTIPFKAGDITCISKNIPHTTYSNPGTKSHWSYIFFDPELLFEHLLPIHLMHYDLSLHMSFGNQLVLNKEKHPAIYSLLLQIINELTEEKNYYQTSTKGLLLSLYIEIYRVQELEPIASKDSSNMLSIAPALGHIEHSYMQNITIDFLAELCGFSESHFRKIFKSIMGFTPMEYVNITRIMKACDLLRSTEETILQISEAVGFRSLSSFNRYFTKVTQSSPKHYRKETVRHSIIKYNGWMKPEIPEKVEQSN